MENMAEEKRKNILYEQRSRKVKTIGSEI